MINLAILISGRGSNMESILCALRSGEIKNIRPSVVISNNPDAAGLLIASQKFGIPTEVVIANGLKGWDYDQKIADVLNQYSVMPNNGLVCLAGYMRIVSVELVRQYKMRILNIHPSLLPSFPGLHAQKQAIEYGVKISGCTIHFVDENIDTGPIVLQKSVPVLDSDTEESLSARILEQEHQMYPEAIRLFAEDRIRINRRRISIKDQL